MFHLKYVKQDDFQSDNYKYKTSQQKFEKRMKSSKRSAFKT